MHTDKTSQVNDVTSRTQAGRHAIVLGGSMAGLLAARVLADHFAQVTLVERDALTEAAEARKGTPQVRHAHVLLAKGQEILFRLFPGLEGELVANGATVCRPADMRWYAFGGYAPPAETDLLLFSMSRPLLEALVRRHVLALPNLTLRAECDIKGIVHNAEQGRVTGALIQSRHEGAAAETLTAELVVDATGRGSRLPQWLEQMGYGKPEESHVKIDMAYMSRVYRRRPGDMAAGKIAYILETPPHTRGGVAFPIEGDRWMITLVGAHGEAAPADAAGFVAYAASLPAPEIYQIVRQAEPLSDFVAHKLPSSQRRHYEKMARFPAGLAVMGDAMCSFNPIYGQGMTVSALEAEALEATLAEQPGAWASFAKRYFARATQWIDIAWSMAVGEDFRYPATTGPKPRGLALLNWYGSKVHAARLRDPQVTLAFVEVMNMRKPPTSLFRPGIVWRVLRAGRGAPIQGPVPSGYAAAGD